jgi:transcription elongation factor GreA
MTNLAFTNETQRPRWPMTAEAWRALVDELEQLRVDTRTLAVAADDGDGLVDLRIAQAVRRRDQLADVLAAAAPVDDRESAVIGSRLTIVDDGGEPDTYTLVAPGQGDPSRGWVSADSPLGAAVLGARAGDSVEVDAPAGRRHVTIVRLE